MMGNRGAIGLFLFNSSSGTLSFLWLISVLFHVLFYSMAARLEFEMTVLFQD